MAGMKLSRLFVVALVLVASCAQQNQNNAPSSVAGAIPARPTAAVREWIRDTEQQAMADGVSPATVHAALDNFVPNPRVEELDRKQPETTITFDAYRHNVVGTVRIHKGADLMRDHAAQLATIEQRTGVPPQIVVALWGIESNFGQNMGGFETVNSLATLAYEGRRADFFRSELIVALHILDQEHMRPDQLRGSWAGAMGQCQFMPSTYWKYAVDADGDGKRDIWNSTDDALASIANYLSAIGWQRNLGWGHEVALAAPIDASEMGLGQSHSLAEWAAKGVTYPDGSALPQNDIEASLLQPDGVGTTAFLAFTNIPVVMRWNHSTYFALSVGLLSDGIARD